MNYDVEQITKEIESLPKGYVSKKVIYGKERYYRQWTENGKLKSEYIPMDKYEEVKEGIEKRKELEKIVKEQTGKKYSSATNKINYEMNVITGKNLKELVKSVKDWKKRDCYDGIQTYLYGTVTPRVCLVYGLRRTGKTTMLHQTIADMKDEDFNKSAYIKGRKNQTMSMLDRDFRKLYDNGYKYIFIDEVTFLEDFIDTSSLLSDVYAGMGMKIVLSGTDSLGLWFASQEELYDRVYTIHTTWIPYAEHSRLLGIDDIDEYIRYGGTLRVGETDFDDMTLRNEEVSFRDDESTRRYIDTAICGNIQHSLKCYDNGTHFRLLQGLYEAHELTGAINRVIEDMNHRFTIKVLTEDFKSSDLKVAKKNLLKERNLQLRTDVLDRIDTNAVTNRLMEILDIQNKEQRTIHITEAHTKQIEEYLKALELIAESEIRYAESNVEQKSILFLQPGMRYCQAQALVNSLQKDNVFTELNEAEKEYVCGNILDEVKGRMLEEIVLYETKEMLEIVNAKVFKLQFAVGEIDMVVYNPENHTCKLFEIKHSTERAEEQSKHLLEENKCNVIEEKYGTITGKYVLYRGESIETNDVNYWNVSEYLKTINYGDITEILSEQTSGFGMKMQ